MKVQLFIAEDNGCYIGETSAICINTNIPELKNQPVLFYGDTKICVIDQVKKVLQEKGLTGSIQLI